MLDFFMPHRKKNRYIDEYVFEETLLAKLANRHPKLAEQQIAIVTLGLKQYFKVALESNMKPIIMPSKVIDDLWHEFILFTREYHQFCNQALGQYLHHMPNKQGQSYTKQGLEAFARTWLLACRLEGISPKAPERLPLIFSMDSQLSIKDGINHDLDECVKKANANRPFDLHSSGGSADGCSACGSSSQHKSSHNSTTPIDGESSTEKGFFSSLFSGDSSCSSDCGGCGGD